MLRVRRTGPQHKPTPFPLLEKQQTRNSFSNQHTLQNFVSSVWGQFVGVLH